MSRTEILKELSKLNSQDRRKILERICDMEETELAVGEKEFLDRRLAECRANPDGWTKWEDAKSRILSKLPKR